MLCKRQIFNKLISRSEIKTILHITDIGISFKKIYKSIRERLDPLDYSIQI